MLDAEELTLRRTAAASALASRYLSRKDSRTLLMIGTGHLAPHLVRAHCAIRPIERVLIWGRTPAKVAACSAALAEDLPIDVRPVTSIEEGMRSADVISCATLSEQPLVRGARLRNGQHVDLVGSYLPTMRESDDAAILRASVFVDSRAGALTEAGDLVQPLRDRVIDASHVCADLTELVRGQCAGRRDEAEITLFKSVGLGLEDLAAASLVLDRRGEASRA
jgi:ornithine cyclodeaminase